ncbi:hypothetical protein WJX74_006218 [Apatococcus lobatus]|uniref:UDP-galactose transporter n=1 Tax=Apatococcus lobatus TaxID=904363 RepID=A0AAW1QUD1_9CHLO
MWPSLDKKSSSSGQPDLEAAIDEALASRPSSSNVTASLKVSPGIAPRGGIMGILQTREGQLGALSMALLVFQGTALSLTLRYSRTMTGTNYLASVAVIYTELIKLLVCMAAQFLECSQASRRHGGHLWIELVQQTREIMQRSTPMAVPAALFVMQQVLVIVAASHLDAVTFQICSQSFKIMPTALFAVWLLGQFLTPMQWASLPVLAVGVVLVTINSGNTTTSNPAAGADLALGLGASALSGLSSAYAGVYFEKYLKGKDAGTLWVRNMQLSIYGLAFSTIYMFIKDGHELSSGGIHQGFDWIAWSVVGLQVFGGLIVGMVVKYSDNIMKNFANALSVIFTVVGAIPLFGQYPSLWFLAGSLLVSLSLFMYQRASTAGFSNFRRMYRTMSTSLLQSDQPGLGYFLTGRSKTGEGREYRPGRTCFRTMVYHSANKLGTMLPATYSRQHLMNRSHQELLVATADQTL